MLRFPKPSLDPLWVIDVGGGYGPPSVVGDRLYHFDRYGNQNRLTCRSASVGIEIWRYEYTTDYEDRYGYDGGPRACPIIDGDRVFIYGAEGDLHAISTEGKLLWKVETRPVYQFVQNFFGVGSAPIVEGDLILVAVGGSPPGPEPDDFREIRPAGSAIVAFDKATGKERYRVGDDLASYASPMVIDHAGRRLGLYFARGGLVGFDAAKGEPLFRHPWRARLMESVNCANPVVLGDTVLLSEAYGQGATLLRLKQAGVETIWADQRELRAKRLTCHWNTPIAIDGFVYGCNGRHTNEAELVCLEAASGQVAWREPIESRSSLTLADGQFWMLSEYGLLTLVRPDPKQYREVDQVNLGPRGSRVLRAPTWAAPVISRGRMYLRGEKTLACFDIYHKPVSSGKSQ